MSFWWDAGVSSSSSSGSILKIGLKGIIDLIGFKLRDLPFDLETGLDAVFFTVLEAGFLAADFEGVFCAVVFTAGLDTFFAAGFALGAAALAAVFLTAGFFTAFEAGFVVFLLVFVVFITCFLFNEIKNELYKNYSTKIKPCV